jgi:hypothetical protein
MISVLTCAGREEDYLERTIASIDRAGGAEYSGRKVIHVDGPLGLVSSVPGWELVSLSERPRRGARHAMTSILHGAADAGVELLLYFEDDVTLCRNAIRAMLEIGVPEPLGFVSYCDLRWDGRPLELVAFPGCPRNAPVADGGFVGCQALALPLRTLERFRVTPPPAWLDRNNCDSTIGTMCQQYGILDSLADHVGAESAIMGRRYERLRVVRGWRGEDFDADTVPRTFTLNEPGERCAFHAGVLHDTRRPCAASTAQHAAFVAPPATDV